MPWPGAVRFSLMAGFFEFVVKHWEALVFFLGGNTSGWGATTYFRIRADNREQAEAERAQQRHELEMQKAEQELNKGRIEVERAQIELDLLALEKLAKGTPNERFIGEVCLVAMRLGWDLQVAASDRADTQLAMLYRLLQSALNWAPADLEADFGRSLKGLSEAEMRSHMIILALEMLHQNQRTSFYIPGLVAAWATTAFQKHQENPSLSVEEIYQEFRTRLTNLSAPESVHAAVMGAPAWAASAMARMTESAEFPKLAQTVERLTQKLGTPKTG